MILRLLPGFFVLTVLAAAPLTAVADTDVPAPPSSAAPAAAVPDSYGFTWSSPPTAAESGALGQQKDAAPAQPAIQSTVLPAVPPLAANPPAQAAAQPVPPAAAATVTVTTTAGAGAAPQEPKPDEEIKVPPAMATKSGILSSDTGEYQYEAVPASGTPAAPEAMLPKESAHHRPLIAIVIDDMGVDRKHSARALKLPAAVTMSYLPYSTQIREQTAEARKAGHELMVHVPMQPDNKTLDPGPNYLGIDMSPLELHDRVIKNLDAFTGYHEVNNHMGSKFTANREGLDVVMTVLAERHLMFLDSRTAADSIAEKVAREHHLQTTHRDIFIDDDDKHAAVVAAQLARTEKVALRTGAAIAIGHPKDITLDALEKWLPTLKAKGFDLVALSTVITRRDPKPAAAVTKPAAAAAEKSGDAPKAPGL